MTFKLTAMMFFKDKESENFEYLFRVESKELASVICNYVLDVLLRFCDGILHVELIEVE